MGRYIGAGSIVTMIIGAAGARIEVVAPIVGFYTFLLGALAGVIAVLWGLIEFLRRRQRPSLVTAGLGLPALVILVIGATGASGAPSINDVSTDLDDPPALSVSAGYPDDFKEVVATHYGDIRPLVVQQSADQAFAVALDQAKARDGWRVSTVDPGNLSFEAYSRSEIFRFRDDFVVRVRAHSAGAVIDMRSRSRVGKSDLGVNASRIRSFLASLTQALTPLTSH